jgi:hypothetical protein
MPRAGFELWLARRYGANATARSRFSNVVRIESAYGSLDEHYRRDRCASIMQSMRYSGADANRNAPNPARLPIVGNVYNGLVTLRNALGLYIEFMSDMDPKLTRRGQRSAPLLEERHHELLQHKNIEIAPKDDSDDTLLCNSQHESGKYVLELLRQYASVKERLKNLGVIRTGNVVGEYGEWLFSKALGWQLAAPSEKHHDAVDGEGVRYQVKARREAGRSGSRQLGIMRNLGEDGWEKLAAVLFAQDFTVAIAVIVPRDVIAEQAVYSDYQKGHIVHLNRSLLKHGRTQDVTDILAAFQNKCIAEI